MDIKIFDRVEKKYLLTEENYRAVVSYAKKHLKKDAYYKSEVFNIYFDTDNFDYIIESIEHPDFKQKLRARSYGGYDKVFLEIKTKLLGRVLDLRYDDGFSTHDNNLGFKRRVLISHKEYDALVNGKKSCEQIIAKKKSSTKSDLQIAKEVDYFITEKNLKPKILVYYDRESFVGENGLRITFDRNLSYRDHHLKFARRVRDPVYFDGDKNIIMELKSPGNLPLELVKVLSEQKIYPQRFSKIGNIFTRVTREGGPPPAALRGRGKSAAGPANIN